MSACSLPLDLDVASYYAGGLDTNPSALETTSGKQMDHDSLRSSKALAFLLIVFLFQDLKIWTMLEQLPLLPVSL